MGKTMTKMGLQAKKGGITKKHQLLLRGESCNVTQKKQVLAA